MYIYIYVYIYVCIYMYIYIYIHTPYSQEFTDEPKAFSTYTDAEYIHSPTSKLVYVHV